MDEPPTKAASAEAWTEESVGYLLETFDADADGLIDEEELLAAANFRGLSLAELRSIQDWYLRYDLMGVDGVAEVASVGGYVRQYQVEVDPEKLRAYGVTLADVNRADPRRQPRRGRSAGRDGRDRVHGAGPGLHRLAGGPGDPSRSRSMRTSTRRCCCRRSRGCRMGPEVRRGPGRMWTAKARSSRALS